MQCTLYVHRNVPTSRSLKICYQRCSKTGLDIKKLKELKCFERIFDGTYLRNNRKQREQQNNPGGMPTEQNQYIHGHLSGGPHRLHTCQLHLFLGPSTLHNMMYSELCLAVPCRRCPCTVHHPLTPPHCRLPPERDRPGIPAACW